MTKIKLSKKFYNLAAIEKSAEDFKGMVKITEEEGYYFVDSEDKQAVLEFSNYAFALCKK